ncbi:MAG: PQQ-binding-like beta-propeller repeat protein, partial [Blastocatellia bacterium]|nr:PQQ-binding-like beta-propeller repeat protein [Blastocatellia bacterium]
MVGAVWGANLLGAYAKAYQLLLLPFQQFAAPVFCRNGDLLYIADFSGLVHCLDAMTGKAHWTYDMFAASWGSPLIVDGKVYIGDEDGDVAVFRHSADPNVAMKEEFGDRVPYYAEINMQNSVYSTPIVANNVLYIANRTHLFA